MERIYLDHNATTPVAPQVLEAMLPWLGAEGYGNPSSAHWFGQRARAAVDGARERVAHLIGSSPAEVVFTGSGTEGDNMALMGVAAAPPPGRRKIVVSPIEHHAVLRAARALASSGWVIETPRVGGDGAVDLDDLASHLDEQTALVAIMLANNETGVLQPVAEACRLAHEQGALMLCDAVQGAGKLPLDVGALGVDFLALSAHKLCGPKGTGALFIRRGTSLAALLRGGSQERNRRAGTENVPGIVGFGKACELAEGLLDTEPHRQATLRDGLESELVSLAGARPNGAGARLPNTTNLSFDGVEAEDLILALDMAGVAASTGAACAAGGTEPSHVLQAMGLPAERVQSSVRFSLGRTTTAEEITRASKAVRSCVDRQRQRR